MRKKYRIIKPRKPLKEHTPIRAKQYSNPVARGSCIGCGEVRDLRFCYNPYGDDDLLCDECVVQRTNYHEEHMGNNR